MKGLLSSISGVRLSPDHRRDKNLHTMGAASAMHWYNMEQDMPPAL